jgi:adenylyltransferase/sulfurtransferase
MAPINAAEFITRINSGENVNILDVREEIEYATYNIGGMNMPLSMISNRMALIPYNKTDEIVVICKIGIRSETARNILIDNGYTNVRNLSGGLIGLQKLNQ